MLPSQLIATKLLALLILVIKFRETSSAPIVVLPSAVRWDATNSVGTFWPRSSYGTGQVQFQLKIRNEQGLVVSSQWYHQMPGNTNVTSPQGFPDDVDFRVTSSPKYTVQIVVNSQVVFDANVTGIPDVSSIHMETDKPRYRLAETVRLRALALTSNGFVAKTPLKFQLKNPSGLVLNEITRENPAYNFVEQSFPLPRYAEPGTWSIIASVADLKTTWMTTFELFDYELPEFSVLLTTNTSETEIVRTGQMYVQLFARYFYGQPVFGMVNLQCRRPISATDFEIKSLASNFNGLHDTGIVPHGEMRVSQEWVDCITYVLIYLLNFT